MIYIFVLSIFTLACRVKSGFNMDPESVTLGHANSSGIMIAISPYEQMIAVGFSDETLKIFHTSLNLLCQIPPKNNSQLIDISWLLSDKLISLDSSNTLSIWSEKCEAISSIKFNKKARGILENEITIDNKTAETIAVNLGDRIEVYDS